MSKFTESGASAQNASMIIFDIRSNGGGSDSFAEKWVKNFTGEKPVLNQAFSNHLTALNGSDYGKEVNDININTGYMIKNNIPIIVLVDNKCGSAGESMLLSLRPLENVIVIGGNSYGAQLCGNMQWYKLPNSGMNVAFGRSNGGRQTFKRQAESEGSADRRKSSDYDYIQRQKVRLLRKFLM